MVVHPILAPQPGHLQFQPAALPFQVALLAEQRVQTVAALVHVGPKGDQADGHRHQQTGQHRQPHAQSHRWATTASDPGSDWDTGLTSASRTSSWPTRSFRGSATVLRFSSARSLASRSSPYMSRAML